MWIKLQRFRRKVRGIFVDFLGNFCEIIFIHNHPHEIQDIPQKNEPFVHTYFSFSCKGKREFPHFHTAYYYDDYEILYYFLSYEKQLSIGNRKEKGVIYP